MCYDQFGGWLEASNHPHLFTGRLLPGYWGDLVFCNSISLLHTSYVFLNVLQIIFLMEGESDRISNAFRLCIHPTPADYHCCCTHFLSVFVKVVNCISELNLIIFMMGQFCSSVLGLTGTSSLSKGPLCLWQCFVSESVGEPDYSTPHLTL